MSERAEVRSPCVDMCVLGDDDVCIGCFRTLTDIAEWSHWNDDQRRVAVTEAAARAELRRGVTDHD